MSLLDWAIFFAFLGWVILDGIRRSRKSDSVEDLFLAGRSAPWWVMGLSIMATQASAITMVTTTGQGWIDGVRFAQFYYALPLAMLILAFTLLPLYHRERVFTVYEFLGKRFGTKTRVLSAVVFLVLRGLSVGIVLLAPSVILSAVLGLRTELTIVVMGLIAVIYTSVGGMRAVLSTDVKQMSVMVVGLVVAFVYALKALPEDVGMAGAIQLAEATDRWIFADWRFDPKEKYTIWSSLLGGTLLFLSYFGCDQSQAQRLLSGKSLRHEQGALLFNAFAKVPFQILILTIGVLLFAVFTLREPPASFVPEVSQESASLSNGSEEERATAALAEARIRWELARDAAQNLLRSPPESTSHSAEFRSASQRAFSARADAQRALAAVNGVGTSVKEVNYVFPYFILHNLPRGFIGLLIAAIFAAALSSIDSELNAMATVLLRDLRPRESRRESGNTHGKRGFRGAICLFGGLAAWFALTVDQEGSLVEAVNQVGSWFYGALLGVFVLAVVTRRVGEVGAVAAICAGILSVVIAEWRIDPLPFLYKNTIGTVSAIAVGWAVSWLYPASLQSLTDRFGDSSAD